MEAFSFSQNFVLVSSLNQIYPRSGMLSWDIRSTSVREFKYQFAILPTTADGVKAKQKLHLRDYS